MKPGHLIRALYAYKPDSPAPNSSLLTCESGDQFILIKSTETEDWFYVINASGHLGYIPANFVSLENVTDVELLAFLDRTLHFLQLMETTDQVAVRQKNHAQVKLNQLRNDVSARIEEAIRSPTQLSINEEVSKGEEREKDISSSLKEEEEEIERISNCTETGSGVSGSNQTEDSISESELFSTRVALELLEKVRTSTDLSHDMCKSAIIVVMDTLAESISDWSTQCHKIGYMLKNLEVIERTHSPIGSTMDSTKLSSIFKSLWFCKNDEQQRSWPIHEDEHMIQSSLQQLLKILKNANPSVSREFVCKNSFENVLMLVTYYQMETRYPLRSSTLSIVLHSIRFGGADLIEHILNSVLPSTLADEMINYPKDIERWTQASTLFTAIFSTGHKPPIRLYEHVNQNFLLKLIEIVEGTDISGNKVDTCIAIETSLPPILSFALHFDNHEDSLVIKALAQRPNASQLTENLVSHLNWEEDPTIIPETCIKVDRPNAVHKLLHEIFSQKETAKLFYYNDVRVLIDIIITHLNNLLAGDRTRIGYLKIAESIILNTPYVEEPHKVVELTKCLEGIANHECSSEAEKELTAKISKLLPSPNTEVLI